MRAAPFVHPELGVTVADVRKRFGRVSALDGATLSLPRDGTCALVGPVGSGKTTLVRTILGLIQPDAGRVSVFGVEMAAYGPEVRNLIGYVPQTVATRHPRLRVSDFLEQRRLYCKAWSDEYARDLVRRFGLSVERRLGALSPGELLLLRLVAASAHRPQLFIWDEPGSALDPVTREQALSLLIEHLAETGSTLILATRSLHHVEHVIDHVGVMQHGRVLMHLPADELRGMVWRSTAPSADTPLPPNVASRVIQRRQVARRTELILWGTRADITAALGADLEPLTLEEAVLALLVGAPVPL